MKLYVVPDGLVQRHLSSSGATQQPSQFPHEHCPPTGQQLGQLPLHPAPSKSLGHVTESASAEWFDRKNGSEGAERIVAKPVDSAATSILVWNIIRVRYFNRYVTESFAKLYLFKFYLFFLLYLNLQAN